MNALANFRRNVRTAMEAAGLTQRAFAEKAGMSYPYINRILTEKVEPSLPMCDRIADKLGYSVAQLLSDPKKFSREMLTSVSR